MNPKTKKILKLSGGIVLVLLSLFLGFILLLNFALRYGVWQSPKVVPQGVEINYDDPRQSPIVYFIRYNNSNGDMKYTLYRKNENGSLDEIGFTDQSYSKDFETKVVFYDSHDPVKKKKIFYYKPTEKLLSAI